MKRGAIQVQYRVPLAMGPVTGAELAGVFDRWRQGLPTAPIKVTVTVWGERLTNTQIRRRLKGRDLRHRIGRVERYAEPTVSMCDYDGALPPLWRLWNRARQFRIIPLAVEDRRTLHGWHRTVWWDRPFTPAELICIQLILGSDREREAFNLQRALTGTTSDRWQCLFTYKL